MLKIWNVKIPELSGEKERRAYIYLPDAYWERPDERFPVLYMFDGHNVFLDSHATYGTSWGMKKYMDETGTPLIIAAIECNDGRNNERLSEYSPYDFFEAGYGFIPGRGKETMEWLVHTFKPFIDENYRTLSDRAHTYISGSSMGGLMTLYALTAYNAYFSKGAALSPSVCFSPKKLEHLFWNVPLDEHTVIYMDYGAEEMRYHRGMLRCYSRLTEVLMRRGAYVTSRIIPGGTHCEASWEKQIPIFMSIFFYPDQEEELPEDIDDTEDIDDIEDIENTDDTDYR